MTEERSEARPDNISNASADAETGRPDRGQRRTCRTDGDASDQRAGSALVGPETAPRRGALVQRQAFS